MLLLGIGASSAAPGPIPGYTVWLDASDTGTITSSGSGDVSQWSDKSVNARNFTQSSGTAKPKTGTRTLNGKNVIDFDGTNDFLSCPSSTALFNYFHNSTGATVFTVGIVDDTAANKMILSNSGGSTDVGFRLRISSAERDNLMIRNAAGTNVAQDQDNITLSSGSGFYLTNKYDGGNATAANRLKISLNGGAFLGDNTVANAPSETNAADDLHLGIKASLIWPWNGAFGEIIMYSGILSNDDIAHNQAYLAAKWGI
jgi:hypothetical protein